METHNKKSLIHTAARMKERRKQIFRDKDFDFSRKGVNLQTYNKNNITNN